MGLLIGPNLSLLRIVYGIHKNEEEKISVAVFECVSIKDPQMYTTYAFVVMGIYVYKICVYYISFTPILGKL